MHSAARTLHVSAWRPLAHRPGDGVCQHRHHRVVQRAELGRLPGGGEMESLPRADFVAVGVTMPAMIFWSVIGLMWLASPGCTPVATCPSDSALA